MRNRRGLAVAIALPLALTACGSTVQQTGAQSAALGGTSAAAPGQAGGDGLGGAAAGAGADAALGAAPGGGAPAPGAPGAGGGAGGGGSAGAGGGSGSGTTAGAPAAAGSGAAAAGAKPGSPVQVGFLVVDGYEEFYKSVGVGGGFGDQRGAVKALVADLNRTGGLAGHPVKPVLGVSDVRRGDPAPVQEQQICSEWTESNKVVAALVHFRVQTLADCLAKRNVPMIFVGEEDYTERQFANWRIHTAPSLFSGEKGAQLLVERAAAQGYFKPTPQDLGPEVNVGVLHYNAPEKKRVVNEVLEPALRKQGVKSITKVEVTYPNSASDGAQAIQQIQGSILTFKARGVTHMIIMDNGGNLTFNFPREAESQGWRPRYAWNSYNAIGLEQQYVPRAQLARSVGVGWYNQFDTDEKRSRPPGPGGQRCLDVLKRQGVTSTYGTARGTQFKQCEVAFTLQAAAKKAGGLAVGPLVQALRSLGPQPSVYGYASTFSGGYFSGAGTMDIAFDSGCQCMAYVGGLRKVS